MKKTKMRIEFHPFSSIQYKKTTEKEENSEENKALYESVDNQCHLCFLSNDGFYDTNIKAAKFA